ncbi:MAG: glycosyltransferase 87 family protein [Anaerolineales bacterium]
MFLVWSAKRFRVTLQTPYLGTHRWLLLAAVGGLSLLVYWLGLLAPYSLEALKLRPLLDIAKLTRGRPGAQINFMLAFAALSCLYYLAWRVCRSVGSDARQRRAVWLALVASLLAINLSMLWLYPIGAADLFDNIVHGRITAQHGGNPFYDLPRGYPQDPFIRYAAWPRSPSAYGPGWELIAAATSHLAGDDRLANVLAFKLMGLVFYAGCSALIAVILNRRAPERALAGVCLFAWNPLVIYETAGNGHNDVVMVFWILLAMYATVRGRSMWAALALTVGALIKFIPVLLLPVVIAAGLRAISGWRARLLFLLRAGLACAALALAFYLPFWRGGDPLSVQRRAAMFTTSLPAFVQAQLEPRLGVETSRSVVAWAALALTGAVVIWQTWRVWRTPIPSSAVPGRGGEAGVGEVIRASTVILLFYLIFTCLWFQGWYSLWPLALAALLPEGALAQTAVLLSYTALWKTIFFDFFLYRGGPIPPRLWRETLLGPATLGLVWSYVGYWLIANFGRLREVLVETRHALSAAEGGGGAPGGGASLRGFNP